MTTISKEYIELNRQMHETDPKYGAGKVTTKWYPQVEMLAKSLGALSILDYGCGKAKMAESMPHLMIESYDPAIPGRDARPDPADFVVSLDVMEHIEPEFVDSVLDDIKALAKRAVFISVSTRAAGRILPDGRNAHLSQHPPKWWLEKFMERFNPLMFSRRETECVFIGEPIAEEIQKKAAA